MPTPTLPSEITPDIKRRLWNEYIQTREGRQKLACSMIQPARDTASYLERGGHDAIVTAEKLLRNSIRLIGHMALDGETLPESLPGALRDLRAVIETCEYPTRWDRLIEDDEDNAEF